MVAQSSKPASNDDPKCDVNKNGENDKEKDSLFTKLLFLNLSSAGVFGDERLLPAIFQELSLAFHASLSQLGALTFAGAISQALSFPLGGVAGDSFLRGRIILGALIGAAISTLWLACSQNYTSLLLGKVANGICIGILVPPLQSLVGDLHDQSRRGEGFGKLVVTGIAGAIMASFLATFFAGDEILGVEGWRAVLVAWAVMLGLLCVGLAVFAVPALDRDDEDRAATWSALSGAAPLETLGKVATDGLERCQAVLRIPTLLVLLVPQAIGGIPWQALMGWATLYLESTGFNNRTTALLVLATGFGFAAGAYLGGVLGDWAETRHRLYGRIILAQVVTVLGTVAFLFVLVGLPRLLDGTDLTTAALAYALSLFLTGLLSIGGTGAACNLPILVSCLPPQQRSTGVAMERFFFAIIASFGTPLVALVAESGFGLHLQEEQPFDDVASSGLLIANEAALNTTAAVSAAVSAAAAAMKPRLAKAALAAAGDGTFRPFASVRGVVLGESLALVAGISWFCSGLLWSFVYYTYPHDRLDQAQPEEDHLLQDSFRPTAL